MLRLFSHDFLAQVVVFSFELCHVLAVFVNLVVYGLKLLETVFFHLLESFKAGAACSDLCCKLGEFGFDVADFDLHF